MQSYLDWQRHFMKNAKIGWYAKEFFPVKYPKFGLSIWYFSVLLFWLLLLESKRATPPETSELLKPQFLYWKWQGPWFFAVFLEHQHMVYCILQAIATPLSFKYHIGEVFWGGCGFWVLWFFFFLKTNSYYLDPGFGFSRNVSLCSHCCFNHFTQWYPRRSIFDHGYSYFS